MIILHILLILPAVVFAQFRPNDTYSIELKKISEEEYAAQKKKSEHLRHEPYKVVENIDKAQKMLGKRLKVIDIKEEGTDYTLREYEITFKDGTKERLDEEFGFVAYFPQLEMLLFEGGHTTDHPLDLNNSYNGVTFTDDYPYNIIIGNPYYHVVSPDKQLRINGLFDGQDCVMWFLEKWNKQRKSYEYLCALIDEEHLYNFCYASDWFWINNEKVLFKSDYGGEHRHCEMKLLRIKQ